MPGRGATTPRKEDRPEAPFWAFNNKVAPAHRVLHFFPVEARFSRFWAACRKTSLSFARVKTDTPDGAVPVCKKCRSVERRMTNRILEI